VSLTSGNRIGPYEVVAAIGAGGMGEVYRARDPKLARDVAIKVLPASVTNDTDRLARFSREAQVLAALNHANIASIYHVEETPNGSALVMELVEGETLADRITRGAIPIDEALSIARQIAAALEAAHEQGIIHRDLKPANIKVRPDGTVKVLDFGLAKLITPNDSNRRNDPNVSRSPTITSPALMTGVGVLLGTAAYMSPEQAKGRDADKRSDLWAFGCVLYEMLTGRCAFRGDDVADTFVLVLSGEPDWGALPATTPAPIRRLLRRCLEKDRRRRLADIADARLDLDDASSPLAQVSEAQSGLVADAPTPRSFRRERMVWAAAVALLGLLSALALVMTFRPAPRQQELRFDITMPFDTAWTSPVISPDGRRIALIARADGRSRVWVHTLDGRGARPLDGTDGAQERVFWSPDSESVGFFADGRLKRIDLESGAVQTLSEASYPLAGGAWSRNGVILFAPKIGPIFRVSQSGGATTAVTRIEGPSIRHTSPQFLPDGRHFLFFSVGDNDLRGLYVAELEGATAPQRVLADVDSAAYVASGHLFFSRQGALLAQKFDAGQMMPVGEPWQVADSISGAELSGTMTFSASETGTLTYVRGDVERVQRRLAWFDRSGKELQRFDGQDPVDTSSFAASPDGRRLAVDHRGTIWLLDLERGGLTKFGSENENFPFWTPDGDRLIFTSRRDRGIPNLSQRALAGGEGELLLSTIGSPIANDWSPDGRLLLYRDLDPRTGFDLWVVSVERESSSGRLKPAPGQKATPVANTPSAEMNGQFSPDGAWIAYESDEQESGDFQVYVQPFPGPGERRQISIDGGRFARWRRDGTELYYYAADGRLMAVPIRRSSGNGPLDVGTPVPLFQVQAQPGGGQRQQYIASNDGQRFLVSTVTNSSPVAVTMIVNWTPPR
jgi:Tol biopolymer transport system component